MKPLILFLVEGASDERALSDILKKIFEDRHLECIVLGGDITSDFSNNDLSMAEILKAKIKSGIKDSDLYDLNDIGEVIQLIDTDGVFAPDEVVKPWSIKPSPSKRVMYYEDRIETGDPQGLSKTRHFKKKNVEELLKMTDLDLGVFNSRNVPFSVFYMSSNLDHVLYGEQNLEMKDKYAHADGFFYQNYDNLGGFLDLLDKKNASHSKEASVSWEYIKRGYNSLKPASNLIIGINEIFKKYSA